MKKINIVLAGVGGQGTILTGQLLGQVFLSMNLDIKVSEVHGMAQRGGAVVTYVKAAEEVNSPVIENGGADVILAFEQLEAVRWISCLKKDGLLIANTQKINPMPVITGAQEYPQDITETLSDTGIKTIFLDAFELAKQAGSPKTVNVVLLGVMAKQLDMDLSLFENAIKEKVKPALVDMNLKALDLGYNA